MKPKLTEDNPNKKLFSFCPSCGEHTLSPIGRKAFCCDACAFTFYINCAAAVIAIIFNAEKKLLVTRRKIEPGKGTMDFPGGFAEPGERAEDSLKREVKEELNLDVTAMTYFCSLPNSYPYRQVTYPVTDICFLCRVDEFEPIKAGDDVSDFNFMDPAVLDKNDFGLTSARRLVEKIQRASVKGLSTI